jgi:hypothetical protein
MAPGRGTVTRFARPELAEPAERSQGVRPRAASQRARL